MGVRRTQKAERGTRRTFRNSSIWFSRIRRFVSLQYIWFREIICMSMFSQLSFWSLALLCFTFTDNVHSECEKKTQKKVQLRDEVFCNYDSLERPVEDHKEVINVTIQLLLKSTDYVSWIYK